MHRKILFGIIAAVVCGLFVSAPSAQAGAVMTTSVGFNPAEMITGHSITTPM